MKQTDSYKIFDMHTHAFPKAIAGRAMNTLSEKAGIPYYHGGSFRNLSEYEERGGVRGFLLLPVATKPSQTRRINEWAASKQGGGALAFGSVHPDCENPGEELDRVVSLGLKGIKLHPEYQEFFVDDEKLFPFYERIFARGLILCFHAGADLGYPPPIRGGAKRIARVCDAFPRARIIAAHMGGLFETQTVKSCLAGRENLWMDTSFAAERMAPEDVRGLARLHGVDRVLFGSDAPWADFETAKNAVANSGLSENELKNIFYENAARLLGISHLE